jgi:hypothetical protein
MHHLSMIIRSSLILASLLSTAVIAALAEPKNNHYDWQAPAVRLTCLPGQDFAVLEPFYLNIMPRHNIEAYAQSLIKQGIYVGTDMTKSVADLPLKASCRLGHQLIEADFTYLASLDLAAGNDPSNTLANMRSRQHCESLNNISLEALKIDGKKVYAHSRFAHPCLDPQIFRIRINPGNKTLNICEQSTGGMPEFAPLEMWYSSLSLDEKGNPPMPEISCTTIRFGK